MTYDSVPTLTVQASCCFTHGRDDSITISITHPGKLTDAHFDYLHERIELMRKTRHEQDIGPALAPE